MKSTNIPENVLLFADSSKPNWLPPDGKTAAITRAGNKYKDYFTKWSEMYDVPNSVPDRIGTPHGKLGDMTNLLFKDGHIANYPPKNIYPNFFAIHSKKEHLIRRSDWNKDWPTP